MASFREALPDLRDEDIIGSPYCVRRYVADERFGGPAGLAAARAALADRGRAADPGLRAQPRRARSPLGHRAPGVLHPGGRRRRRGRPGRLAAGRRARARARPRPVLPALAGRRPARTRSPPSCATATAQTLSDIADQCDGIRCDMAMLMTNDVFAKTWGEPDRAARRPRSSGRRSSPSCATQHPETVLIAEAYWDMEWDAAAAGLRLLLRQAALRPDPRAATRPTLRGHLRADLDYQSRLVRFLENHDEPRIADKLPAGLRAGGGRRHRDPARRDPVARGAVRGAAGPRRRSSSHRRPDEPPDEELAAWYRGLLATVAERRVRTGRLAAAGGRGLARQPVLPQPDRLVVDAGDDAATSAGTWSWSTSPDARPRPRSRCRGRTCPAAAGACTDLLSGATSPATAASWRTPGCTSTCSRGSSTCWRCARGVTALARVPPAPRGCPWQRG